MVLMLLSKHKIKKSWNKILCWWYGHDWSEEYLWRFPFIKKCFRCDKRIFDPPPIHPMCRCITRKIENVK